MALAKVLWLKGNMAPEEFERCKFFDLHDGLTELATRGRGLMCDGGGCVHGLEPDGFGVDGSVKGWKGELFEEIGLGEFAGDRGERVGGYCSVGCLRL